jgi:chromosome segregation ATPase
MSKLRIKRVALQCIMVSKTYDLTVCYVCVRSDISKHPNSSSCSFTAERDNWKPAIQALRDGGAEDSAAFETERHGALVEEARELEEKHQTEELFRGRADQLERRRSWMDVAGDAIAGLDQEQVDEAATTQQGKAQQAHSHMKDATNAIHERGHKINQLGSKASDLDNNAGEYKDLAAKVRQKLENKNKGLNFLNPFSGR